MSHHQRHQPRNLNSSYSYGPALCNPASFLLQLNLFGYFASSNPSLPEWIMESYEKSIYIRKSPILDIAP